jgi:hypothetical protein
VRDHFLAQRPEIGRIAKHLADLHRQIIEQARKHRLVVEKIRLHGREAGIAKLPAGLDEAPFDRGAGIVPEVVVVLLEKCFEQELDFDVLDGFAHQRGIQTRTSDNSLSTSIGLAI